MQVLEGRSVGAPVQTITNEVAALIGEVPASSVRSYLRLNTPELFARTERAQYMLSGFESVAARTSRVSTGGDQPFRYGRAVLYRADCLEWLQAQPSSSVHAVVTDPPYGLIEYSDAEQAKLRAGQGGGVWRVPPSFDGNKRSPLPRFTVLKSEDLQALERFFLAWGRALLRVVVPGANVVVASNPLLSYLVAGALSKAAHVEFSDVSVMPRSMWDPWLLFRKPLEGRVQDNLRRWGTGGFRRNSKDRPFGDVIESAPTRAAERKLAHHPSLKPQAFLRKVVRGVLPLGSGVVLDPFAGSGSTLAAAEAVGYQSVGIERDVAYFDLATAALPRLAALRVDDGASR